MVKITLDEALSRPSTVYHAKLAATSEDDTRRHMIEDGFDPDAELQPAETICPPRYVRGLLGLDQEGFAALLRAPLAVVRAGEDGPGPADPATRALMTVLARAPGPAVAALTPRSEAAE